MGADSCTPRAVLLPLPLPLMGTMGALVSVSHGATAAPRTIQTCARRGHEHCAKTILEQARDTHRVAPRPAHSSIRVVADAVLRDGDEDDVEEEDDGGEECGEEREREGRPDECASASGAGPGAGTVPAEDREREEEGEEGEAAG